MWVQRGDCASPRITLQPLTGWAPVLAAAKVRSWRSHPVWSFIKRSCMSKRSGFFSGGSQVYRPVLLPCTVTFHCSQHALVASSTPANLLLVNDLCLGKFIFYNVSSKRKALFSPVHLAPDTAQLCREPVRLSWSKYQLCCNYVQSKH